MKYPIKFTKKTEFLPIALVVVSIILGIYFYMHFSEIVTMHWNFQGVADGFGGRFVGAFAMPLMMTLMYVLFLVFPSLDPKKDRYPEFEKTYYIIRSAIMGVCFVAFIIMGISNLGSSVEIGPIVAMTVGAFMMISGNFMGKLKRNSYMGIRTPWTLRSENVWNKTHRFGGWMFIIFGLVIIVAPYLTYNLALVLFLLGLGLIIFGTAVYSYILYSKEKKNL